MADRVLAVTHIHGLAGRRDELRELMRTTEDATRAEPGCLNYDLHQSVSDPTEFLFHENWASEEALRTHSASEGEHRLALRRQLGGLVDGPPRITSWRRIEQAS